MTIELRIKQVDTNAVEGIIVVNGRESRVRTTASVSLDASGTPWLPPATVLATTIGGPLSVDRPVDEVALAGAEDAAKILQSWYPEMSPLNVAAAQQQVAIPGARGVGHFFSGGLDAFYTLLMNRDVITQLILVHGFDISPNRTRPYERICSVARKVATALGMELIEVRTDSQFLHARYGGNWASAAHGAALAHVALLLSPHLSRVIIASSYDDQQLHPHGSHPQLDLPAVARRPQPGAGRSTGRRTVAKFAETKVASVPMARS